MLAFYWGRRDGASVLATVFCVAAGAAFNAGGALAQPNGVGADPDGDGNPATDVFGFYREAADTSDQFDRPFKVVTFDPPPGRHNDVLTAQYADGPGVRFSEGLKLQICEGQRYMQYDSRCTYEAPASGKYAAVYTAAPRRPLRISFDKPVCAASLAMYPIGGTEGERFRVNMTLLRDTGEESPPAKVGSTTVDFTWTRNTFRWRNKVMAFLENASADHIELEMRSLKQQDADADARAKFAEFVAAGGEPPRLSEAEIRARKLAQAERRTRRIDFLIDDVAFIQKTDILDGNVCASTLAGIRTASAEARQAEGAE